MTAFDTNVWIHLFGGVETRETRLAKELLESGLTVTIPMVVAELFSVPIPQPFSDALAEVRMLDIQAGYWSRCGLLRRSLKKHGASPKMVDSMIAQMCIDHQVMLLSTDRDFEVFARHAALKLA